MSRKSLRVRISPARPAIMGITRVLFAALLLVLSLTVGAQPHPLGAIAPEKQDFERYPAINISLRDPAPIPDRFTLEDYLPPIGSQGQTGSCVGWSTAYYCYSIAVARQRQLDGTARKDEKFIFSPGWIWNQYNGGESQRGMLIFQAFDVLEKMGCATLDVYPWVEKAIPFAPSDAAKEKAAFYKAKKTLVLFRGTLYGDAADPEKMRHWLAETKTAIVLAIPIYTDFPFGTVADDYTYEHTSSDKKFYGNHALCVIGYDRQRHAFEIVNSWGSQWGNHGKLWIAEDFLRDHAFQGCVQTPGGPRIRGMQIVPAQNIGSKPRLR